MGERHNLAKIEMDDRFRLNVWSDELHCYVRGRPHGVTLWMRIRAAWAVIRGTHCAMPWFREGPHD